MLVDDFKGHSNENVKAYTSILKSGTNAISDNTKYSLCEWLVMGGGITRILQTIDKFLGKIFKGNYREYYDDYMLSATTNDKGNTVATSHQLCAILVVNG